jgi:hypothetical protein
MASPIELAKAHFKAQSVKTIEVPEWGEANKPLLIYATPLTLAEKRKLFNGAKENDLAVLVDCIIMKAKDEKGDAVFTLEHKRDLMNGVDPDIIARIANEILTTLSQEELLKN